MGITNDSLMLQHLVGTVTTGLCKFDTETNIPQQALLRTKVTTCVLYYQQKCRMIISEITLS